MAVLALDLAKSFCVQRTYILVRATTIASYIYLLGMSFVLSVARQSYLSIHYWQPLLSNDVSASVFIYRSKL